MPIAEGVYDTEHMAAGPLPLVLQLVELKVPIPFVEKYTGPVGVVAPVPELSVTVTVQIVFEFTSTDEGLHVKAVLVELPEITDNVLRPPPFTM